MILPRWKVILWSAPLPSGISWASDLPTPLEFPIPSVVGVWIFSGTTQFFLFTLFFITDYAPPTPTVSSSSSSSSSSLSPSLSSSSSSSSGQSSLSSHLPLSSPILLTSSVPSPSPSSIVILSTRTLGMSQALSSYLTSAQLQTAKLSTQATSPTGIPHQSTGAKVKPSTVCLC